MVASPERLFSGEIATRLALGDECVSTICFSPDLASLSKKCQVDIISVISFFPPFDEGFSVDLRFTNVRLGEVL